VLGWVLVEMEVLVRLLFLALMDIGLWRLVVVEKVVLGKWRRGAMEIVQMDFTLEPIMAVEIAMKQLQLLKPMRR